MKLKIRGKEYEVGDGLDPKQVIVHSINNRKFTFTFHEFINFPEEYSACPRFRASMSMVIEGKLSVYADYNDFWKNIDGDVNPFDVIMGRLLKKVQNEIDYYQKLNLCICCGKRMRKNEA